MKGKTKLKLKSFSVASTENMTFVPIGSIQKVAAPYIHVYVFQVSKTHVFEWSTTIHNPLFFLVKLLFPSTYSHLMASHYKLTVSQLSLIHHQHTSIFLNQHFPPNFLIVQNFKWLLLSTLSASSSSI